LVSAFALLLAGLLFAASAGASKTHNFKETFGSAAQPSFGSPGGVAIDQSTGDVLVMDTNSPPSIKRYNPDGTPHSFSALGSNVIDGKEGADATPQSGLGLSNASESQLAIDNSGGATDGDIYVTQNSPNVINIFASTGAYLGQLSAAGATNFSEACGVAVDPSGAVYVGDYSSGIKKFVPAANPVVNADHVATFTTTSSPCTLAAGAGASAGFLFPARYGGAISKIDASTGELKYTVSADSHTTVSVNPANGYVYGATGSSIKEFDASGAGSATLLSTTKLSNSARGVGVRGSSGDLFVSRSGGSKLEVFAGALTTFPDVVTSAASGLTDSEATLNGTVNPDGVALTECFFEWGTSTAYGETASCVPGPGGIGAGTSPVAVAADLSGLNGGTVYHFRLKAANANGQIVGSDMSFQTLGPLVKDVWSQDITFTEAALKAEIDPEGAETTYHF
jgi:hypothetical protein